MKKLELEIRNGYVERIQLDGVNLVAPLGFDDEITLKVRVIDDYCEVVCVGVEVSLKIEGMKSSDMTIMGCAINKVEIENSSLLLFLLNNKNENEGVIIKSSILEECPKTLLPSWISGEGKIILENVEGIVGTTRKTTLYRNTKMLKINYYEDYFKMTEKYF